MSESLFAMYVKFSGMSMMGYAFAGSVVAPRWPTPTCLPVVRSEMVASILDMWMGRKLDPVLNSIEIAAGKLKFAGEREKMVGTSFDHDSVAFLSGLLDGKRKSGTRGIVKARTMPTLGEDVK